MDIPARTKSKAMVFLNIEAGTVSEFSENLVSECGKHFQLEKKKPDADDTHL